MVKRIATHMEHANTTIMEHLPANVNRSGLERIASNENVLRLIFSSHNINKWENPTLLEGKRPISIVTMKGGYKKLSFGKIQ